MGGCAYVTPTLLLCFFVRVDGTIPEYVCPRCGHFNPSARSLRKGAQTQSSAGPQTPARPAPGQHGPSPLSSAQPSSGVHGSPAASEDSTMDVDDS